MAFREELNDPEVYKELKKFSGASWQELEDIWPKEVRISSEVYKIMSVLYPAWKLLSKKYDFRRNEGVTLRLDEFFLLFWVHRCEDAKENVATAPYPIGKPLSYNARMLSFKTSRLFRLKLIENMPFKGIRVYRVTAKGKLLMREFIENLEQAHKDIKYFSKDQPPENAEMMNGVMRRWFEIGGLFKDER